MADYISPEDIGAAEVRLPEACRPDVNIDRK